MGLGFKGRDRASAEEVEPGEVRCDESELLAQGSLGQTTRCADGEPVGRDVENHQRAVITPKGKGEAGNQLQCIPFYRSLA